MMTAASGLYTGRRNTFSVQWYFNASTVVQGSSASFLPASVHRGSTIGCTVSITNAYGTKTIGITPIALL
jgi:hypothetical protein